MIGGTQPALKEVEVDILKILNDEQKTAYNNPDIVDTLRKGLLIKNYEIDTTANKEIFLEKFNDWTKKWALVAKQNADRQNEKEQREQPQKIDQKEQREKEQREQQKIDQKEKEQREQQEIQRQQYLKGLTYAEFQQENPKGKMPSFNAGRDRQTYSCLKMVQWPFTKGSNVQTYYVCTSAQCPDYLIPKNVYIFDESSDEYKQIGTYNDNTNNTITYM
jgi:hypothetical protein